MDFSTSNLITLGGVFTSIIGAWYLLRYQVGELRKADEEQRDEMKAVWTRLEDVKERLGLVEQKMSVISSMLRPEAVAEHTVKQANMAKDIEYLRRDTNKMLEKCRDCK